MKKKKNTTTNVSLLRRIYDLLHEENVCLGIIPIIIDENGKNTVSNELLNVDLYSTFNVDGNEVFYITSKAKEKAELKIKEIIIDDDKKEVISAVIEDGGVDVTIFMVLLKKTYVTEEVFETRMDGTLDKVKKPLLMYFEQFEKFVPIQLFTRYTSDIIRANKNNITDIGRNYCENQWMLPWPQEVGAKFEGLTLDADIVKKETKACMAVRCHLISDDTKYFDITFNLPLMEIMQIKDIFK